MIKLFVTGDIHIGLKYDRYPEVREQLIRSRFECLKRCVKQAEREYCDFFVITGDLFDRVSNIAKKDIRQVVEILSAFDGRVIVLPGNHDYYTGEELLWNDFLEEMQKNPGNIILVREFKPFSFDTGDETVTFYPAFCQSKHAEENNLGWIKATEWDDADYHVGLAHGAIQGLTPDMKNEYFLMTERELNNIPVDAWLIGHTHIPYPGDLKEDIETVGRTIFNAGTPEQTDLANNTEGVCLVLSLKKEAGRTAVAARSYQSGAVRFFDVAADADRKDLREAVRKAVAELPQKNSVIRLTLSGAVSSEDYADRQQIYREMLGGFLTYETDDRNLAELITREKIRAEFAEIGFAAEFLESLTDPKEIQMAYDLIKRHQS